MTIDDKLIDALAQYRMNPTELDQETLDRTTVNLIKQICNEEQGA